MSILEAAKRDITQREKIAASLEMVGSMAGRKVNGVLNFGDFSEIALAEALVQKYPDVRYVDKWKSFLIWDGKQWAKDEKQLMMTRSREICKEAARQSNGRGRSLKRKQTVMAVWGLTQSDIEYATTTEQWDQDPWLLNTPSGVMDLRSGHMREHSPDDYMTKITAVAPGGDCPKWKDFLYRIMNDHADLIAYLQRLAGYGLTGSTREHVLPFFHGSCPWLYC